MKNPIGIFYNISRAYEIALLGGFSIQLIADKEYKQASEDYSFLKSFFKEVPFVSNGDLVLELKKPYSYIENSKSETLEHIYNRANFAHKNKRRMSGDDLDVACNALLETTIRRFELGLYKIARIRNISSVIAQLDLSADKIRVEHVAEAIQFVIADSDLLKDDFVNLEDNTIRFGNGIIISKTKIEKEKIKEAIDYLKNLL